MMMKSRRIFAQVFCGILICGAVGLFVPSAIQAEGKRHGPSLKHILKGLFPPCGIGTRGERFVVSPKRPGEVCDNRTGLHWQQVVEERSIGWPEAIAYCDLLPLNGRKWRLAGNKEYISLINYLVADQATFLNQPIGKFQGVQPISYWSRLLTARNDRFAWTIDFDNGTVDPTPWQGSSAGAWCVYGGNEEYNIP